MANEKNLRRGGLIPGGLEAANAAQQKAAEEAEAMRKLGETQPEDALLELHGKIAEGLLVATNKWLTAIKSKPDEQKIASARNLMDIAREFRQLSDRVIEILKRRGRATEAEGFFATLATRLSEANLAEGPRPVSTDT